MLNMNTLAIIGASGFLGKHLVKEAIRTGNWRIRVLSRSSQKDAQIAPPESNVEIVIGDARDVKALRQLIEPGCTVVNLVYLPGAGVANNLAACEGLLMACKAANVRRLIHCSTASVVGRTADNLVTEDTPCRPVTEYGITKLKVEHAIAEGARGYIDTAIVRPTAVFGPGGAQLIKLIEDLTGGNRVRNYLRSCLFGRRRMNLVHVANVVAAILFLARREESLAGDTFIVSDDDHPSNNFADVERFLMRELNVPDYRAPRLPIPPGLLSLLLRCLGRDNINPRCNYDPGKLVVLGLQRPVGFEAGLVDYSRWYRSSNPDMKASSPA